MCPSGTVTTLWISSVCRGGGTPAAPVPMNELSVIWNSRLSESSSLTCGVTAIVVPASAKPAKLVVATVSLALTLVNGTSETLVSVPVSLSLTSTRGEEMTFDREWSESARSTTSATSGSISAPLKPSPGSTDSAPVAGSTVESPNELKPNSRPAPERSPPETSTPSVNSSDVSRETTRASISTCGRWRSSCSIRRAYVCCTVGLATTMIELLGTSAETCAATICRASSIARSGARPGASWLFVTCTSTRSSPKNPGGLGSVRVPIGNGPSLTSGFRRLAGFSTGTFGPFGSRAPGSRLNRPAPANGSAAAAAAGKPTPPPPYPPKPPNPPPCRACSVISTSSAVAYFSL